MQRSTKITWSVIGGFAVLTILGIFLMSSVPAKRHGPETANNSDQLKLIESLGFTHAKNLDLVEDYDARLNPVLTEKYKALGFRYMSDKGLKKYNDAFNYILGAPHKFTSEIPAANIDEMNSKIKKLSEIGSHAYYVNRRLEEGDPLFWVDEADISEAAITELNSNSCCKVVWAERNLNNHNGKKYPESAEANLIIHKSTATSGSVPITVMVAAPEKDFNTEGEIIINGILSKPVDPIILAKVSDGWVILTQWYN
jgi:hypothetical protein